MSAITTHYTLEKKHRDYSLEPAPNSTMRRSEALTFVLANLVAISMAHPTDCPDIVSCPSSASDHQINPCCLPSPGGLFVFRERLQLDEADDMGNWGIEGLGVLECVVGVSATYRTSADIAAVLRVDLSPRTHPHHPTQQ